MQFVTTPFLNVEPQALVAPHSELTLIAACSVTVAAVVAATKVHVL